MAEQNEQTTFNAEAYKEKMQRIDAEIRANNLAEENNKLLDVINNQDVKIADLEKSRTDFPLTPSYILTPVSQSQAARKLLITSLCKCV